MVKKDLKLVNISNVYFSQVEIQNTIPEIKNWVTIHIIYSYQ